MVRLRRASLVAAFLFVVAAISLSVTSVDAQQLAYRYYRTTCPNVEKIIYNEVKKAFTKDRTIAPGILRLVFHDCFVRGCDASILLAGRNTERASVRNDRLHGFEVIDTIKAALEKACPKTVSCADILAYASRDSVVVTGGSSWKVFGGRRDGLVSNKVEPEQNIPSGFADSQELISTFAQQGLTVQQMVTLSGSHTLGVTHCEHITNRIYTPVDKTMPKDLLKKLQKTCPKATTGTPIVIDQNSEHKFDTQYFKNVKAGRGVMTSDQTLYVDESTRRFVDKNLNQGTFEHLFGQAMFALSNINPTLFPDGEIRKRCQYRN